ncbi:hypothetical protein D9M69_628570 [compost metagenome]
MPISSHCFWPWLSRPASVRSLSARPMSSATACTFDFTSSSHLKANAPNTERPLGKDTSRFWNTLRFS